MTDQSGVFPSRFISIVVSSLSSSVSWSSVYCTVRIRATTRKTPEQTVARCLASFFLRKSVRSFTKSLVSVRDTPCDMLADLEIGALDSDVIRHDNLSRRCLIKLNCSGFGTLPRNRAGSSMLHPPHRLRNSDLSCRMLWPRSANAPNFGTFSLQINCSTRQTKFGNNPLLMMSQRAHHTILSRNDKHLLGDLKIRNHIAREGVTDAVVVRVQQTM